MPKMFQISMSEAGRHVTVTIETPEPPPEGLGTPPHPPYGVSFGSARTPDHGFDRGTQSGASLDRDESGPRPAAIGDGKILDQVIKLIEFLKKIGLF